MICSSLGLLQVCERLMVQFDDVVVATADDQERRRGNRAEQRLG
jgi:hypothetical protein